MWVSSPVLEMFVCSPIISFSQEMNSRCLLFLRALHLSSPLLLSGFPFKSPPGPQIRGLIQHPDTRSAASSAAATLTAYTCNKAGQSDPIRSDPSRSNPLERVKSGQIHGDICPLVSAPIQLQCKTLLQSGDSDSTAVLHLAQTTLHPA